MALMDIMLSDLPRVEYHPNDGHITQKDVEKAVEKQQKLDEHKLKIGGGIGAKLSNVVNTENFMKSKMREV